MNETRTVTTRYDYPLLVGLLLGCVQTGLFLQLSFTLSSSFQTYLLVTLFWLVGSALGVWWLQRINIRLEGFLLMMLGAYGVCSIVLLSAPFDTRLWWLYGVLIGMTGVYPGVFFAQSSRLYRARDLFFMENNGFILGIVLTTILFMLFGRVVLWAGPVLLTGLLLLIGKPRRQLFDML